MFLKWLLFVPQKKPPWRAHFTAFRENWHIHTQTHIRNFLPNIPRASDSIETSPSPHYLHAAIQDSNGQERIHDAEEPRRRDTGTHHCRWVEGEHLVWQPQAQLLQLHWDTDDQIPPSAVPHENNLLSRTPWYGDKTSSTRRHTDC